MEPEDDAEIPNQERSLLLRRSIAVLDEIRSAFSLQMASVGVVLILIGYVLQSGVWAAILPIWGTAIALAGLAAYGFVRFSHHTFEDPADN